MILFRNELEAREKVNVENNFEEKPYSGSALHSSSSDSKSFYKEGFKKINLARTLNKYLKKINVVKVSSCYAYFVDENISISCDIITKPEVRKNILKTEKRCFKCLKQGHLVSDCRSKRICIIWVL